MSEAKQKEKAEITNEAERRGKILPRRQAAKGTWSDRHGVRLHLGSLGPFILRNKTKRKPAKKNQKEGKITVRFHLKEVFGP